MGGNIEITADLGTMGQFQAELMAPKIPEVKESIKKVLEDTLSNLESELTTIIQDAIGSELTIEIGTA